jgi:stress-induced-phosphoprotein 1
MQEMKDRAERDKRAGNQAFENAEYAQAAVHYTTAIDNANSAAELGDPLPLLHVCYANRAACFLKLGQHEKALDDAESCVKLNPEFVKGHFRKGLALHAMGRYDEALPALGLASNLENPKNKASKKQIDEAITFAQAKLAAQLRKAQGL